MANQEFIQITKLSWANAPIDFYYNAMLRTRDRANAVETSNQQFLDVLNEFSTAFQALDDAYQHSMASASTETIRVLDEERDVCAMVMQNVAKQWMRLPVDAMAQIGRRVDQVFKDLDFRASVAMTAENTKIQNMEQRFQETQLAEDLAAMGLTDINAMMYQKTQQLATLLDERADERAEHVKGEVKAAREAMDTVYQKFVKIVNALIITGAVPALENYVTQLNSVYRDIEEQIKQSKKLPTVLVTSKVVGNHRYSVSEFATWQTIIDQNEKTFAVADDGSDRILSTLPKAAKVGGLYLALGTVAVKPTDAVNAKKEYTLLYVTPQPEPTPVVPE